MQGFFVQLLSHKTLIRVDRSKGKFRSFLLASLQKYASNELDKARCLKRGGKAEFVYLDLEGAEDRYGLEAVDTLSPQKIFDAPSEASDIECLISGAHGAATQLLSWSFVEGETLENLIRRLGRLEAKLALEITSQVAAGLEAVHEQKLVHRDIKPSNIMARLNDKGRLSPKIMQIGNKTKT